jgi:aminopeptidase N
MFRKSLLAAVVASVVLAALASGASAAGPKHFSPGAPGLGDPYLPLAGNGGYDIGHYDLDLTYDPATGVLVGVETITARATQNLSRFDLDFVGLTLHSLKIDGKAATWTRDDGELVVTPKKGIRKGTTFKLVAKYDGVPEIVDDEFGLSGFFATDDGVIVSGEPRVSATWFPSNDHPRDRASFTFKITVPSGLEAVANGVLKSQRTHGAWTTWTWDAKEPMATYLAGMGIGHFDIRSYQAGGIKFWDAVDSRLFTDGSGLGDTILLTFDKQPDILAFEAGFFGKYPFKASGGIVDVEPRLGFALENQTRPIYPDNNLGDEIDNDFLVVHELAHQWFGDRLALDTWQHIWLNEGFATYAEWLWSEDQDLGTTQENFDFWYDVIPADDPFWDLPIGDPGFVDMFDDEIYIRGAMTLQALRITVGDAAFFKILRDWVKTQAGSTVSTDEFIRLAEKVSHQDLDAFFDEWLGSGHPTAPPVSFAATERRSASAAVPADARSLMARLHMTSRH